MANDPIDGDQEDGFSDQTVIDSLLDALRGICLEQCPDVGFLIVAVGPAYQETDEAHPTQGFAVRCNAASLPTSVTMAAEAIKSLALSEVEATTKPLILVPNEEP